MYIIHSQARDCQGLENNNLLIVVFNAMPRCANRTRGQQKGAEGILRFWKERHCVRTRCYCHDFHPLPEHHLVMKQNQGMETQEEKLGPVIKLCKRNIMARRKVFHLVSVPVVVTYIWTCLSKLIKSRT